MHYCHSYTFVYVDCDERLLWNVSNGSADIDAHVVVDDEDDGPQCRKHV